MSRRKKLSEDEKRRRMREAQRRLDEKQVVFHVLNGGLHLEVEERWDFWPTTGLAIDRWTGERFCGIDAFMEEIRKEMGFRSEDEE